MIMPAVNAEGEILDILYLLTPEPGGKISKLFMYIIYDSFLI